MTALPVPDRVYLEHVMATPKLEHAVASGFVAMLETPLATMVESLLGLQMAWLLLALGTLAA